MLYSGFNFIPWILHVLYIFECERSVLALGMVFCQNLNLILNPLSSSMDLIHDAVGLFVQRTLNGNDLVKRFSVDQTVG